ncbi:C40 family peptidase [Bacillus sporothermodurans]|uniref:C40 family peptidase n=1 Tax=Heyndrickxia sporothermodurans TaxID=46224 RepID=UPI00192B7EAA|nr:C40 family peptidase [Heyndrickxia sporothermodurans]MBL5777567.1 C40 family peptidase [Heyndrickxia sporothermodurans]
MELYQINVAVATLWTSKDSARKIDVDAITNPVDIPKWLNSLTYETKLDLCNDNLVQSQVLLGEEAQVIEIDGDWAFCVIPSQSSKKDDRGYPGWIPLNQLRKKEEEENNYDQVAVVCQPTATLYEKPGNKWMEVSYQTKLPIVETLEEYSKVKVPSGYAYLKNEDIHIFKINEAPRQNGEIIIREAEKFIGLPYLWGGMSGFGFDCSGFSYTMCNAAGYIIARDAHEQADGGIDVDLQQIQPGDLLFFAYEEGKGHIHHVAIYYGEGEMIHSPNTGKSIVIEEIAGTYEKELCAARRYWI